MIKPSPFQTKAMAVPEEFDLFAGGGRGGGKSYLLALLALRHAEQQGAKARILYVRKTYKSLSDFELLTRDMFATIYGTAAQYKQHEHQWRIPTKNGTAIFELGALEGPGDYSKYQGRSFTLLLVDECGEYPSPTDIDRLRSNLRGPRGVPIRTVMAANPGGVGHSWLSKRYVFQAAPWMPFEERTSGRQWVYAPSTYLDNPAIDQDVYERQIRASAPTDQELLRAWLTGDWAIARGAYFGGVIDEARTGSDPWPRLPSIGDGWDFYLAHDYGSAAPSVTYLCALSAGAHGPDARYYPTDSIVLVDELATVDPDDPMQGMGYTVPRLADEIKDFCKRWGTRPQGVADDAIFADHGSKEGSIAQEFRRSGVVWRRARKGSRVAGWETMRRLLADAGKPDVPGLYVSRACSYWWETVPFLGRDPRRVEDVDTRGPDHAADACRYGCNPPPKMAKEINLPFVY